MIGAHKVLAAYGCLAPRLATGTFDPTRHRAIWPSTGNYCRGGVAVSRVMGCRGVAVLPEGMSRERFDWLEQLGRRRGDIIKTPGTESNVKEIYDRCHELALDKDNVILNQFCEFGNHIVHRLATGTALERIVEHLSLVAARAQGTAFVSATGSAGTIGAGDHLKDRFGSLTVAVEALECPTLLYNGFGEHNIQGIGDKHVPLIHNVMGTDVVIAVSDRATDSLNAARQHRRRPGLSGRVRGVSTRDDHGLARSAFRAGATCWPPIKLAKRLHLGEDDLVLTVATDGAAMYPSELAGGAGALTADGFRVVSAAQVHGRVPARRGRRPRPRAAPTPTGTGSSTLATTPGSNSRACRSRSSRPAATRVSGAHCSILVPVWDDLITELNGRSGALATA